MHGKCDLLQTYVFLKRNTNLRVRRDFGGPLGCMFGQFGGSEGDFGKFWVLWEATLKTLGGGKGILGCSRGDLDAERGPTDAQVVAKKAPR